ncbi:Hsp20/alpha crystallin family protein [Thalassotalea aquiviva]|uniref:Hsp20/alpha crystallin family protein n=1 Tax=Thalassotalea aquiviva TaxID=3242415 RepID=UPI00352A2967
MGLVTRNNWFDMEPFVSHFLTPDDKSAKNDFFSPRVDINEKDDRYEIKADLPGVKKEDINIELHEGMLTLTAKTFSEVESEKNKVLRKERRSGFFSRSFNIGNGVSNDDIDAKFEDGVLTINFQKMPERIDETKKIQVH